MLFKPVLNYQYVSKLLEAWLGALLYCHKTGRDDLGQLLAKEMDVVTSQLIRLRL